MAVWYRFSCLILLLPLAFPAWATGDPVTQEMDTIATDRPDFVESSQVVGAGRWQIEGGLSRQRQSAGNARSSVFTSPLLLRMGVGADWELRAETDGRTVQRTREGAAPTVRTQGWSDLSLGLKWHVLDEAGATPSAALLLHVDGATGSAAFRASGWRPSLRAVAEWDLPGNNSLGIMPGVAYERNDSGGRYLAGILGIVAGHALSDRLRVFAELAAERIARTRNGGTELVFNAGCAYVLSPAWQLDFAIGKGLNHLTPDSAATIGLSRKF